MCRLYYSILSLILLFIVSSCNETKSLKNITEDSYTGDPLEKSAFLKKDLPWFAQFQVGESPVLGFPEETANERELRMKNWADAKYGLFLHWGPQRSGAEHIIPQDTLAKFNPVDFNAEEWVLKAKDLGFKYMVITAKHHAGFSMFDSKHTDYDIVDQTPFKRDPIKELSAACEKHNILFGVYYSVWDLYHPDYSKEIGNADYKNYHEFMLNQVEELLTNYGPMVSVWFDGEWVNSWTVERATEFRNKIRALQPNTVIANRIGQRRRGEGDHQSPENFLPYIGDQNEYWEGCAKFDGSWFYDGTNKSQTAEWALYKLCYATSRGGNFLMNLGPTPKGNFLESSINKLDKVGKWLKTNGESIYGAQKGPHYLLEWGTCTRKGTVLYYQVFDWPSNRKLVIPGLLSEIESVSLLVNGTPLKYSKQESAVVVTVPKTALDPMVTVIKVELKEDVKVDHAIRAFAKKFESVDHMREVPKGGYFLSAAFAKVHGDQLYFYYGTGSGAQRENLKGWTEKSDWAEWELLAEEEGDYAIEITYANLTSGGSFEVKIANQTFEHTVKKIDKQPKAKESPLSVNYKTFNLGKVKLEPGRYKLSVKPIHITEEAIVYHQGLMTLRDITLIPQ